MSTSSVNVCCLPLNLQLLLFRFWYSSCSLHVLHFILTILKNSLSTCSWLHWHFETQILKGSLLHRVITIMPLPCALHGLLANTCMELPLVCCHLYLHVICAAAECICVSIQWDMDEHGNLKIKPCLPTMLLFVGTNFPFWDNSQLNQKLALSTTSFVNLGVCRTLCQLL